MLTSAVFHFKYNVLIVTTLLLLLLESKYSHMRKFQNSDWPKEGSDPQYAEEMFRLELWDDQSETFAEGQ